MNQRLIKKGKYLCYVLRHKPEALGLSLDEHGWAVVDDLIEAMIRSGRNISRAELLEVVRLDDKQRFSFSTDSRLIRANQGHSIRVDLELTPAPPPDTLFHGTVERFLDKIKVQGLKKGSRHHVHLSVDAETAAKVGSRRGPAIILTVEAGRMHKQGHEFFLSENRVWLTEMVPAQYLIFPEL